MTQSTISAMVLAPALNTMTTTTNLASHAHKTLLSVTQPVTESPLKVAAASRDTVLTPLSLSARRPVSLTSTTTLLPTTASTALPTL